MYTLRHTNATLFVTVLSACLGLLIGAPSQIHAQPVKAKTAGGSQSASDLPQCPAATPEVEKLLDQRKFISPPFVSFVAKVREWIVRGNSYNFGIYIDTPFRGHVDHMTINNSGSALSSAAAEDFANEVETFLAVTDALCYHEGVAHFSVTFQTTTAELITNVAFRQQSPEQARKLAASLNAMLSTGACRERGLTTELFYQNTKALADKDHIFIVTRLPRAALREPLVEKPVAD
jgi:hypothetical protein